MPEAKSQTDAGPDLSRLRISREDSRPPRSKTPLAVLVVVLLGGAGWWAWRSGWLRPPGALHEPAAREVDVARVEGGSAVEQTAKTTANGYVVARRRAALSTVLSGRLVEVNVEEGNPVKAGATVARIQHDDYDAALVAAQNDTKVARARRDETAKSLEASRLDLDRLLGENDVLRRLVDQAKAEADRAARDVERNKELHDKQLIDDGTWDRLKAGAASQEAAVEAAKTKVRAGEAAEVAWKGEIARRQAVLATQDAEVARAAQAEETAAILVEKTFVRAPFAGIVVHKDAEVGEVVAATGSGGNSRGSVATIVDPETLEVQVELPETRLGKIGEGDLTTITLDADPSRSYPGHVRQVWPTADRQKATVEMRVVFDERPKVVKTEMGVRVDFLPKAAGPAVVESKPVRVPSRAVVVRGGDHVVFLVANAAVRRVVVEVGAPEGTSVVVKKGLVGGERVVLDPAADLEDGMQVRVREAR
jgi:RND family efflux transporter MFP subunit